MEKISKDRNLSENPLMLLFIQFEEETKAMNE